jgi:hypothetical protein
MRLTNYGQSCNAFIDIFGLTTEIVQHLFTTRLND